MIKSIVAGAVALTVAGAGLALAQQATQQEPQHKAERYRMSAQDAAAYADARIAGLKAGLKLTAGQEKHWPAIETALRELSKQRADRMKEHSERRAERREARRSGGDRTGADMIERMRRGSDAMGARAASMKKLADASEPLYTSLDDAQKRRFAKLLRMGGREGRGHGHRWHRRAESAR